MKMNKYVILGSIGVFVFISGAFWEIAVQYPGVFKNIMINIIMPPTYRLLEVTGLIIFITAIYHAFKNQINKMESE